MNKFKTSFRMDKIAEGVTPLDKELIVDDAKMGSAILSIRAKIQIFLSKPLCRHLETIKSKKNIIFEETRLI